MAGGRAGAGQDAADGVFPVLPQAGAGGVRPLPRRRPPVGRQQLVPPLPLLEFRLKLQGRIAFDNWMILIQILHIPCLYIYDDVDDALAVVHASDFILDHLAFFGLSLSASASFPLNLKTVLARVSLYRSIRLRLLL